MSEKYTATRIIAAAAIGGAVLTGCGSGESGSNQVEGKTPPPLTFTPETPQPSKTAPEVSPSALPIDIISGKGSALVCRGLVVLQVPEGFRTVANPILDPTSKQPLFLENFSREGVTLDKERDSAQPGSWYDLQGSPKNLADLSCKEQVLYTHSVTLPQENRGIVVTTSSQEFAGVTRLDLDALQGSNGLVDHDFGIESEVGMTQRLEQLAQLPQQQ